MDKLTQEQKNQMFQYMEQNQDTDFTIVAKHFNKLFNVSLTNKDVSDFYVNILMGS